TRQLAVGTNFKTRFAARIVHRKHLVRKRNRNDRAVALYPPSVFAATGDALKRDLSRRQRTAAATHLGRQIGLRTHLQNSAADQQRRHSFSDAAHAFGKLYFEASDRGG